MTVAGRTGSVMRMVIACGGGEHSGRLCGGDRQTGSGGEEMDMSFCRGGVGDRESWKVGLSKHI